MFVALNIILFSGSEEVCETVCPFGIFSGGLDFVSSLGILLNRVYFVCIIYRAQHAYLSKVSKHLQSWHSLPWLRHYTEEIPPLLQS